MIEGVESHILNTRRLLSKVPRVYWVFRVLVTARLSSLLDLLCPHLRLIALQT
jgi:hypothetical protein